MGLLFEIMAWIALLFGLFFYVYIFAYETSLLSFIFSTIGERKDEMWRQKWSP